jgi:hypothetical protein
MADDEISETGCQARFAQWEKLGVDAIEQDLATGGHRLIGGPPQVRALAREWVRLKKEGTFAAPRKFQGNSLELIEAIERATSGSPTPVVLEEGHDAIEAAEMRAAAPQEESPSPTLPEKPSELLTLKPGIWA